MKEMKDWIRERADEIAGEEYDKDFYDLSAEMQDIVYSRAMDDYVDYYSAYCDSVYERMKDKEMGQCIPNK